jgi:cation transport protein ChaC
MTKPFITRESILKGAIRHLAETSGDSGPWVSDAERNAILDSALEHENIEDGVWLFGYGSLIWNPAIKFSEKNVGIIYGYHRSFCLWSTIGRGTPEKPGLMLGLRRGGCCKGVFYRIDAVDVRTELDIVFQRELITSAYRPVWLTARFGNRTGDRAIAFVMNQDHERYSGSLKIETIAKIIAEAKGSLGSCSEYLYETVEKLNDLGIPDQNLISLVKEVRAREQNLPNKST